MPTDPQVTVVPPQEETQTPRLQPASSPAVPPQVTPARPRPYFGPPPPDPDDTEGIFHATEALWRAYDSLGELVRFADSKASIVLAANGAAITVMVALLSREQGARDFIRNHPFLTVMLIVAFFCSMASTYCASACLDPRMRVGLRRPQPKTEAIPPDAPPAREHRSLLFFEQITRHYSRPEDYANAALAAFTDPREAFDQVSHQVYWNSRVASAKYRAVRAANGFLGATVLAGAIGAFYAILYLVNGH